MKRKYFFPVFLTFLLLLSLMVCGCGQENRNDDFLGSADNPVTLRVLVEETDNQATSRLNYWARMAFEKKYEHVDVVFEEIPVDREERELVITQLRTEIMAGGGPDVYLLLTRENGNEYDFYFGSSIDPLFADVNQTMRNGLFFDFSRYYDADTELDKENLVTAVMDAGVVDKARYVLPLRYKFGVAYADREQLAAAGLAVENLVASGAIGMMDAVSQAGLQVAHPNEYNTSFLKIGLNCLPQAVDYDREKVLLTQDDVVAFLKAYRSFRACEVEDVSNSYNYGEYGTYWAASAGYIDMFNVEDVPVAGPCCMKIETLETVFEQVQMNRAAGVDLEMIPVTDPEGNLVADVTYYGAINAECQYPKLAYEFLRLFLSKEIQWETVIYYHDMYGYAADGFPVRTTGFPEAMNQNMPNYDKANRGDEGKNSRYMAMGAVEFDESEMPILQVRIDRVEFPIQAERELDDLLYEITAETTDEEIQTIAQEWLRTLEFHLSES